jgi:hypothetical protein
MFREWVLFLYSVNYLLAPAITYFLESDKIRYGMKISQDYYFTLAFPGMIFFTIGMYLIPSRIFKPSLGKINRTSIINEQFLVRLTLLGIGLNSVRNFVPGELSFFIYLFSLVRFVGAFSLYSVSNQKYWWLTLLVLSIEIFSGFIKGMYHDAIMWLIFFAMYYTYFNKPSIKVKILGLFGLIIFVLFVQSIKGIYRSQVWSGEKDASIETIAGIGTDLASSDEVTNEQNLLSTLNRANQAWIFASTIDRMDRYGDFQGMNNVNLYLEAALLPRFLAPNKIKSGGESGRNIFNQFSGHELHEGTSMGLGIFADGYIAFGKSGVLIFGFFLGLMFSLVFKLIEGWTNISAFYVFFLLPILNYAVRPDCELQTTINHMVKGIVIFGLLVYLTKRRFVIFSLDSNRNLGQVKIAK